MLADTVLLASVECSADTHSDIFRHIGLGGRKPDVISVSQDSSTVQASELQLESQQPVALFSKVWEMPAC